MSRYFRGTVGKAELEICHTLVRECCILCFSLPSGWRKMLIMILGLYCINYICPKPTVVLIIAQCTSGHLLRTITIVN